MLEALEAQHWYAYDWEWQLYISCESRRASAIPICKLRQTSNL